MKVTNKLFFFRNKLKLSQEEVAKRAKVSLRNYVKLEKGQATPRLKTAIQIAHALGESIERVFTLNNSHEK